MQPYYSASGIHLYHGDNASLPEAMTAHGLKVSDVALLWGDPPYGVSERTDRKSKGRGKLAACNDFAPVAGDDAPFDPGPWLAFPRVALWGANHFCDGLPGSPSWWVWDKRDGIPSNDNADCELAWTSLGGPARLCVHRWNGMIKASEREKTRVHPTQKPVALAAWGFQQAKLKPGDWVVSPWLGSGPEARAALDMGLNFIGFELVEEYLQACVGRLRQQNLFTLGGAA